MHTKIRVKKNRASVKALKTQILLFVARKVRTNRVPRSPRSLRDVAKRARALRARRGVPSRRNPSWVLPLVSRAPINLLVGSGRQRAWQFLTARLTAARLSNREKRVPALSRGNELPCSTSFALSTTLESLSRPASWPKSQQSPSPRLWPSSCSNYSERNVIPARTTSTDIVRGS